MDDNEVPRIGKCNMCQKMAILVDLACEGCRKRHGPRCGHIAHQIRTNPSFALYARNMALTKYGPEVLALFEDMFDTVKIKIVEN